MPLPEYRYQNGEPWQGPGDRPRRLPKTPAAAPESSPSPRRDFAARARARRALAAADPAWSGRPPEERRALIARYVDLEAGS